MKLPSASPEVLVVVSALVSRSLVLAVLAAAAAALALFLAQRPVLLALVAITLVPVTSGLRRDLPIPGYRLSEVLTDRRALIFIGIWLATNVRAAEATILVPLASAPVP